MVNFVLKLALKCSWGDVLLNVYGVSKNSGISDIPIWKVQQKPSIEPDKSTLDQSEYTSFSQKRPKISIFLEIGKNSKM